jgi:hypothetical protein
VHASPLEVVAFFLPQLADPTLPHRYCFGWANQSWTGVWHVESRPAASGPRAGVELSRHAAAREPKEAIRREQAMPGPHMMFVKSWNEWAEGSTMEPDQLFGQAFLDALERGLRPGP